MPKTQNLPQTKHVILKIIGTDYTSVLSGARDSLWRVTRGFLGADCGVGYMTMHLLEFIKLQLRVNFTDVNYTSLKPT